MFWWLLSHAYPVKDFSVSCGLSVRNCTRSSERARLKQVTQSSQSGIPYCRTSYPVYKLGEVTLQGSIMTWRQAELVARIVLWSLVSLSSISLPCFLLHLLLIILITILIIILLFIIIMCVLFCFVPIIQLFLFQPMSFTLFLILPIPLWRRCSERAAAWYLIACLD